MKYLLVFALMIGFASCGDNGTGNRTDTKEIVTHDQPSSNPNTSTTNADSTSHVQDSSTNLSYDTSTKKR